jgi:hypothetical protein
MEFESSTSEHTEVPNDYQVDMISTLQNIKVLLPEYENATLPGFQLGIHNLETKYMKFRRVRGDGNCFYRSLLFGYLEGLLTKHIEGSLKEIADIERKRMLKTITDSKEELIQFGYSEIAIELQQEYTEKILNPYISYGFLVWNYIEIYDFIKSKIILKEYEEPDTSHNNTNFYVTILPREKLQSGKINRNIYKIKIKNKNKNKKKLKQKQNYKKYTKKF